MSELERQEFETVICAMSEEEMKMAASKIAELNEDILWDELRKRATNNRNLLQGVKDLVKRCV